MRKGFKKANATRMSVARCGWTQRNLCFCQWQNANESLLLRQNRQGSTEPCRFYLFTLHFSVFSLADFGGSNSEEVQGVRFVDILHYNNLLANICCTIQSKDKKTMLKFGMPTLIETNTLDACAVLCQELDLDFIELNMNLPQYQLDKIDIFRFKEIANKYGIFYTIHLDENLNICDFNPYIADGYQRTVTETIELAKKLEISVINMHLSSGVYFTLPNRKVYLFSEYKEQYLRGIADFRMICEKAIGSSDIIICIENSDGFHEFQKEAICILLGSPVFGLTFDIGHNHGCGGLDEPYIINNKSHLCHMHVHNALGKKNHLAFGMGELDLDKYFALAMERNCRVVLETKTIEGLKQSVK